MTLGRMWTYYGSDCEDLGVLLAVHAKVNPSLPARDPGRLWTTINSR